MTLLVVIMRRHLLPLQKWAPLEQSFPCNFTVIASPPSGHKKCTWGSSIRSLYGSSTRDHWYFKLGCLCRLRRSLYVLKQAPWAWSKKCQHTHRLSDFQESKYGPSMFLQCSSTKVTNLLVIITWTDYQHLSIPRFSSFPFMYDLGTLAYYLGLKVCASKKGTS